MSRSSVNRSKTLDRRRKIERKEERIRNCADKKGDGWIDGWNLERKRNYGGGGDEEQRRMKEDREKEKGGGGGGDGKIEARSPRGELQNCL